LSLDRLLLEGLRYEVYLVFIAGGRNQVFEKLHVVALKLRLFLFYLRKVLYCFLGLRNYWLY
jgi:hypothetical protein